MASNHYFLELEPPAERLRHAPHVVIVGGGFAGVHACTALARDAEDAHFPMASGKGPSIAEPDSALKAAMDYNAH